MQRILFNCSHLARFTRRTALTTCSSAYATGVRAVAGITQIARITATFSAMPRGVPQALPRGLILLSVSIAISAVKSLPLVAPKARKRDLSFQLGIDSVAILCEHSLVDPSGHQ
jgi:hypothetical protein